MLDHEAEGAIVTNQAAIVEDLARLDQRSGYPWLADILVEDYTLTVRRRLTLSTYHVRHYPAAVATMSAQTEAGAVLEESSLAAVGARSTGPQERDP